MQKTIFKIEGNKGVAKDCFRMVLSSPVQTCMAPGQFVDIALEGFFLRRPISVCDCSADASGTLLTLLYKTVGDGTRAMASMHPGQTLELLAPLGNGFDLSACRGRALLVGGGIGTAPLYLLCRELLAAGREVCAVFGFNTAAEAVLLDHGFAIPIHTNDRVYTFGKLNVFEGPYAAFGFSTLRYKGQHVMETSMGMEEFEAAYQTWLEERDAALAAAAE